MSFGRAIPGQPNRPDAGEWNRAQDAATKIGRDSQPFGDVPAPVRSLLDYSHLLTIRAVGSSLASANRVGYPVMLDGGVGGESVAWFDPAYGPRTSSAEPETTTMLARRPEPKRSPAVLIEAGEVSGWSGSSLRPWGVVLGSAGAAVGGAGGTSDQLVVAVAGVLWARVILRDPSHRYADPVVLPTLEEDPREGDADPWPLISARRGSAAILWAADDDHATASGERWAVLQLTGATRSDWFQVWGRIVARTTEVDALPPTILYTAESIDGEFAVSTPSRPIRTAYNDAPLVTPAAVGSLCSIAVYRDAAGAETIGLYECDERLAFAPCDGSAFLYAGGGETNAEYFVVGRSGTPVVGRSGNVIVSREGRRAGNPEDRIITGRSKDIVYGRSRNAIIGRSAIVSPDHYNSIVSGRSRETVIGRSQRIATGSAPVTDIDTPSIG